MSPSRWQRLVTSCLVKIDSNMISKTVNIITFQNTVDSAAENQILSNQSMCSTAYRNCNFVCFLQLKWFSEQLVGAVTRLGWILYCPENVQMFGVCLFEVLYLIVQLSVMRSPPPARHHLVTPRFSLRRPNITRRNVVTGSGELTLQQGMEWRKYASS